MPSPGTLTIGAVVRALVEEFPDLTISKVRFLEAQGLVTPERTDSGYRRFSTADVDRLRWVLRVQRDRFWPLTRIRAALEEVDRGLDPSWSGPATVPGELDEGGEPAEPAVDPEGLLARGPLRLSADELADAADLSPADVSALVEHGVLRRRTDGTFDGHDLAAARAAAGLAVLGLEARHLRVFRAAADREGALLHQATATLRGTEATSARDEALRHVLALHAALVRGAVADGR